MLMHPGGMFVGFVLREKQTCETPIENALTIPLWLFARTNWDLEDDHVPVGSATPTTVAESC